MNSGRTDELARKNTLQEMKLKIEQIEKLACELNDLGQGIPVIEKNVQSFLNTVFVLKFGISDISEIDAA